jgi:hypothetical protein
MVWWTIWYACSASVISLPSESFVIKTRPLAPINPSTLKPKNDRLAQLRPLSTSANPLVRRTSRTDVLANYHLQNLWVVLEVRAHEWAAGVKRGYRSWRCTPGTDRRARAIVRPSLRRDVRPGGVLVLWPTSAVDPAASSSSAAGSASAVASAGPHAE